MIELEEQRAWFFAHDAYTASMWRAIWESNFGWVTKIPKKGEAMGVFAYVLSAPIKL